MTRREESVQAEEHMQGDREARDTWALERLTGGRGQEQSSLGTRVRVEAGEAGREGTSGTLRAARRGP